MFGRRRRQLDRIEISLHILIGATRMANQGLADLKAQLTRIAADIKTALAIITNPDSEDAEVEAAAQTLSGLADSIEAVIPPAPSV